MAYGKGRYWSMVVWLLLFLPRFAIASDCFSEVGSNVKLIGCTKAEIVLQTPSDSYKGQIYYDGEQAAGTSKGVVFKFGNCEMKGTLFADSGGDFIKFGVIDTLTFPVQISVYKNSVTLTGKQGFLSRNCPDLFEKIDDGNFKTELSITGEAGAYLTVTAFDTKIHGSTYNILGMPAWALALLIVSLFVLLAVVLACSIYWIWLRKRLALTNAPSKAKPKKDVAPPIAPPKTVVPQPAVVSQSVVSPKVEEVLESRKKTVSREQPSMEKPIPEKRSMEEPVKMAPRKKPSKTPTTKSRKTPSKKLSKKLRKKNSGKKKTRTQGSDEKTARVELPSFEKTLSIEEMLKSQKTQSDANTEKDDGKSSDENFTSEENPLQGFAVSPPYFAEEFLKPSIAKYPILVQLLNLNPANRRYEIYFKVDSEQVQIQASGALKELEKSGDLDENTAKLICELEAIKSIADEVQSFKASNDKTVFYFPWSFVAIGEILSLPVKSLKKAIKSELPTDHQCRRIIQECKLFEDELKQKKNLPASMIANLEERSKFLREQLVVPTPRGEIRPPDDFFTK